jgi:hypothetical protein
LSLAPESISLCIINRNGARWLPHSIQHLADAVGEIVFVDTGSTDASVTLARDYGARIFEITWPDDFSKARNTYLNEARLPWILTLDADEILKLDDFKALLASFDDGWGAAARFSVRHYHSYRHRPRWQEVRGDPGLPIEVCGYTSTMNVKLFPRFRGLTYRYPVHESVLPALLERNIPLVDAHIPIHHLGLVSLDDTARWMRVARNVRLGLRKIEEYPWSAEGYLELADLACEYDKPATARLLVEAAVGLRLNSPAIPSGKASFDAANPCDDVLQIRRSMEELLGRALFEIGEFAEVELYLGRNEDYESLMRLAIARLHLGRLEAAWETANQARQLRPHVPEALSLLLRIAKRADKDNATTTRICDALVTALRRLR